MGKLLLPVIAAHDRTRFAVRAYALAPPENADPLTARFKATVDEFVNVAALDDRAAAEAIAADDLDLLVDLIGHSAYARPGILRSSPRGSWSRISAITARWDCPRSTTRSPIATPTRRRRRAGSSRRYCLSTPACCRCAVSRPRRTRRSRGQRSECAATHGAAQCDRIWVATCLTPSWPSWAATAHCSGTLSSAEATMTLAIASPWTAAGTSTWRVTAAPPGAARCGRPPGTDAFAAKLGSDGSLVWNTFLGGGQLDNGNGIAVDSSGNVYVAGDSWTAWGSPVRAHTGSYNAFVAKLASNGSPDSGTPSSAGAAKIMAVASPWTAAGASM